MNRNTFHAKLNRINYNKFTEKEKEAIKKALDYYIKELIEFKSKL